MSQSYSPSPLSTERRFTRAAQVGSVGIGGNNPIRVQSMLTSDTRETEACVEEALGLVPHVGVDAFRHGARPLAASRSARPMGREKAPVRAQAGELSLWLLPADPTAEIT